MNMFKMDKFAGKIGASEGIEPLPKIRKMLIVQAVLKNEILKTHTGVHKKKG